MIESTGGYFLLLTIIVTVDSVADHVVDLADPADLVDSVVDLTHPADLPVDDSVLRSVEALLSTISVFCACVLCAIKCLDLCLGFSSDNCITS